MSPRAGGGPRDRPTLEMVAVAAGVSRGTASRALNHSPHVSPHALAAVQLAAQQLGYRPNLAARSLVLGRADSVAVVVSETDEKLFSDPFFAAIVRGVQAALIGTGTQLVLTLAHSDEQREQLVRFAAGGHLDGVVLVSMHGTDPLLLALEDAQIPLVVTGRVEPVDPVRPPRWWVDSDNRDGARAGTEYLLSTGRRCVVTIAGPADMAVGQDRLRGWRDAVSVAAAGAGSLTGHGPGFEFGAWAEHGDFSEHSGAVAMTRLLERVPDLDGVFAANDLMALGALRVLRAAGRRVPQDVGLVGFDDVAPASRSDPPLTTMAQPIDEMGRLMTQMLLARVRGEEVAQQQVVVPTRLVVRGST